MKPDPQTHHRRSVRMPGYDYTQPGAYFVTICTHHRECLFDDPVLRRVAETYWQAIPSHATHVTLDASVVMPNHLHGIIVIEGHRPTVGARHSLRGTFFTDGSQHDETGAAVESAAGNASPLQSHILGPPSGSLGAIVGNFKSVAARRINRIRRTPGLKVWQRNYYEHVIRNGRALHRIREYITNNPQRWDLDIENPATWQGGKTPDARGYYASIWEE
jgi:putative transposase